MKRCLWEWCCASAEQFAAWNFCSLLFAICDITECTLHSNAQSIYA